MKFYDTNALLLLQNKIFDEHFCISSVSLQELENIKVSRNKDDNIKYKARKILHLLDDNSDKYDVVIYTNDIEQIIVDKKIEISPDTKICASALYYGRYLDNFIFVTNDIACKVISKYIFGLDVENISNSVDIYKGYKEIKGNTDTINLIMSNIDYNDWHINEYLIINNTDDETVKEMRFDGEKFVSLKLPSSKFIKGKNALQRCALDALLNPDITICAILGGYGSGKSHLSTKMALYNVLEKGHQSTIHMVREPIGEGHEVGYLSGSFEEKTEQFFLPLVQQLDGGEFELESLKQRGIIEAHIPYYCKGLTFNNAVVVVDEAEDLSEKQIKLIGTRVGTNSKIIFDGDYKQAVTNATEDNALVKMCSKLKGNPMFATVYLGEDVRSETSKLFANIFE